MVFLSKSTKRKSEIACAARVIMISFVEQLSRFTVLNVHEDATSIKRWRFLDLREHLVLFFAVFSVKVLNDGGKDSLGTCHSWRLG